MRFIKLSLIAFVFFSLSSCKALSELVHDGEVVAKVGSHRLYKSQVSEVVPNGLSQIDSANLAKKYINSWLTDQLFLDIAEEKLSKSEKDVTKELEEYRQALLKYRYEQRYVNERLNTNVTDEQIEQYYETHQKEFILRYPIVKARFISMLQASPNYEIIKKKLSSGKKSDIDDADSLGFASALRYVSYGDDWTELSNLAKEFSNNGEFFYPYAKKGVFEVSDNNGNVNIAVILTILRAGEPAPVEYCSPKIKDIILSDRKHELLNNLEKDLLENAKRNSNFVIY